MLSSVLSSMYVGFSHMCVTKSLLYLLISRTGTGHGPFCFLVLKQPKVSQESGGDRYINTAIVSIRFPRFVSSNEKSVRPADTARSYRSTVPLIPHSGSQVRNLPPRAAALPPDMLRASDVK